MPCCFTNALVNESALLYPHFTARSIIFSCPFLPKMKLNVGETIEVGGVEGIVCFSTIYNNVNYVCVAFEEDKPRYEIYKCKQMFQTLY